MKIIDQGITIDDYRVIVPVNQMEFIDGGNTIWIHSSLNGTVLRIKCSGKIKMEQCKASPLTHGDVLVNGDISICVGPDSKS